MVMNMDSYAFDNVRATRLYFRHINIDALPQNAFSSVTVRWLYLNGGTIGALEQGVRGENNKINS